jgi:diadenosine tetraphosphate (Ap4A) HIT family hydrolase
VGECVFCEIVAGRAPASVVYEDDASMAFMDIGAVNPGHLLVIPKRHVVGLEDLDDETGMHLFRVTTSMAAAVRRSGLRCDGINLFLADGEAAFQEVFHLHLHVLPRFQGDSFRIDADWSVRPPREELDQTAALIRRAMARPETVD